MQYIECKKTIIYIKKKWFVFKIEIKYGIFGKLSTKSNVKILYNVYNIYKYVIKKYISVILTFYIIDSVFLT